MLNASAKEFVPAVSPCGAAAAGTDAAATPSKSSGLYIKAIDGISQSDAPEGCGGGNGACGGGRVCSPSGGGGGKGQLSPQAPVFVPRGAACAATTGSSGLLETSSSDPPRSVLTPPPSDSDLSSSAASREADVSWADMVEEAEEHPCAGASLEGVTDSAYCYGGEQGYEDSGYAPAPGAALPGGEVMPQDGGASYDPYNYGVYEGYAMPYAVVSCDTEPQQGGPVYYDAVYDGATVSYESYPQGMYYWDESTGAYVYDDSAYACEYGNWQYDNGLMSQSFQHVLPDGSPSSSPAQAWGPAAFDAAGFTDADAELTLEAGLSELSGEEGVSVSGEQLRSMAPADAAELLEMFFPHYAGDALSRLLERTGGDLLAAFSELAAMERQVGAERAASASTAGGRGQPHPRSGGGRGGRSPGGGRKRSGGGGAAFKLDLEAFPSLPATPGKPAQPASTIPEADPEVDSEQAVASTAASAAPATVPDSVTESAATPPLTAATAAAPAAANSSDRPNFASLLRSSSSAAGTSTSAPSQSGPQSQTQQQRGSGVSGSGCTTGRGADAVGSIGGARSSRGGAAAVPWVSTGEAVAGQYADERREAAMLARARNQYFQQATLAYLSGNKALAKQLGRKGRELNEAMKAAHAAAARRIFTQRNAPHQLRNGGQASAPSSRRRQQQRARGANGAAASSGSTATGECGEGPRQQRQQQQQQEAREAAGDVLFVDVHGLHAAEAIVLLEAQIEEARAAGCRLLRVCTGTGSHTKGAKTPARLPAAVTDTLLSNHLTFKTLKPGLLEARL